MDREYISMDEAGRVLLASRSTLYRMIEAGKIESKTFGRRRVISVASIKAYQEGSDADRAPVAA